MHLNSAQIQQQSSIVWVLVIDGGRAQIYRYHRHTDTSPMRDTKRRPYDEAVKHHALTPVPGMELKAESLDDFQVGSDGRGTLIGGQHSAHNTCEPRLNIHDEVKQNLVLAIAAKLKQACLDKTFDRLVIAAPPKILGALRQHLDADVTKCVIAEINKDFTNDNNHALLAHLQETLSEIHIG
jgi:protein required for attachment to host cells